MSQTLDILLGIGLQKLT